MPDSDGGLPLVTVAIPLYNHERYLRDCLDSVLAEGYPNLEIVVVDDGSKDGSLALARAWMAENGHLVRRCVVLTQPNRGICPTLNRLIRESAGEFVVPIASDDRLRPGGILPRLRLLQDKPGSLAVMANVAIIDEDGNVLTDDGLGRYFNLSRPHLVDARSRPAEVLLRSNGGPLLLVRRSAYLGADGIGLWDDALSFEDRDFFLRILARPEGLLYLDSIVAEYRIHPHQHVGEHVRDKTKHSRIAPDYVAVGRRHAILYDAPMRRAILLDARMAEMHWDPSSNALVRSAFTRLVRRYKQHVRAIYHRRAKAGTGAS